MYETWRRCPKHATILAGEVHLWRIPLDLPDSQVGQLRITLNPDELARADRFRAERLRRRFVVGRGAMRSILGHYLRIAPDQVVFEYGSHGKPALAGQRNSPDRVEFNLAHTQDVALCAATLGRAVGVDIEFIHPLIDAERIITRFFSAAEQAEFLNAPEPERLNAFFRGWSRKEAFLKATGAGISAGLDTFDVSLGVSTSALLRVGGDPDEASRWTLFDVDVGPDFSATAAVEGAVDSVECWRWGADD